jgi:hypothetical protein
MISLVNYENIICVVRMLPIGEIDVIQVFAVLNGCVTVTGRAHPRSWKAEMAGPMVCDILCALNILRAHFNMMCRRMVLGKVIGLVILAFVPVDT